MRMKAIVNRISLVIVFAAAPALRCMSDIGYGGSGSSSGNPGFTGRVMSAEGSPARRAVVKCLPAMYNPVADDAAAGIHDTADDEGRYTFTCVKPGAYTIEAFDRDNGDRCMRTGIVVDSAFDTLPADTLRSPGRIKLLFQSVFDMVNGYMYLPGTTRFGYCGGGFVLIDSVPPGVVPTVFYAEKNGVVAPRPVRDDIPVAPGSTVIAPNAEWRFSATIRLNTTASGAGVAGVVTGFPALVRLTKDNFIFGQAQTDGRDIRFSKSDGTFVPFEIEQWNFADARAALWVRIDTVYGNDNGRCILMYWGNAFAPGASNGAAVFDSATGFRSVLHFAKDCHDATGANAGTDYGTGDTAGMIGACKIFRGADSVVLPGLLGSPASVTISAWARLDSVDKKGSEVFSIGDIVVLRMDDIGSSDGRGTRGSYRFDTARFHVTSDSQYYAKTGWRYLTYAIDEKNSTQALYIDGVLSGVTDFPDSIRYKGFGANTVIGRHGCGKEGLQYIGLLDEVRVSAAALSADWIRLCYMNQQADDKLLVISGSRR